MRQGFVNLILIISIVFTIFFDLRADCAHQGKLTIKNNETFVIENETFTQTGGDIFVEDNGKLIIRNATLQIKQNYHQQYRVFLYQNGQIEFSGSVLNAQYGTAMILQDSSKVSILDSNLGNTTLSMGGNTELYGKNISDESELYLAIGSNPYKNPSDLTRITMDNCYLHILDIGLKENWELNLTNFNYKNINHLDLVQGANFTAPFEIHLKNIRLNHFSVTTQGQSKLRSSNSKIPQVNIEHNTGQSVHLENCEVDNINILGEHFISLNLEGLKKGYIENFDLSQKGSGFQFKLKIINTTLNNGWGFSGFIDGVARIKNCDIGIVHPRRGKFHISDSTVDEFWSDHFGDEQHQNNEIRWQNVTLKRWTNHLLCYYVFKGDVEIIHADLSNSNKGPCIGAFTKREFTVRTVSGTSYVVLDGQHTLFGGKTDSNGEAKFTMDFDCSNVEHLYSLQAPTIERTATFSLASSTPILKIYPPLNAAVSGEKKSYLFKDVHTNVIRWEENTKNDHLANFSYKVFYRIQGDTQFHFLTEVNSSTFTYRHEDIGTSIHEYKIRIVTPYGEESEFSEIAE